MLPPIYVAWSVQYWSVVIVEIVSVNFFDLPARIANDVFIMLFWTEERTNTVVL